MDFFLDILFGFLCFFLLFLFTATLSDFDSRIKILENHHSNVCVECGQFIEKGELKWLKCFLL